ncbi:hypothetical protein QR98_0013980 [Sarcoptes scabiei]|uniref:Uncharacterized protein n=1 Tax=Sarcoptes scabiei TaxID=52283 RepID=A0A131ZWE1_SARSC|nr:hypothetical protein QR98_0013980 [Sarcoptes scabiei]
MSIQITIEDHFIPYLVLLFNTIIFHSIRLTIKTISPISINLFVQEIISTIELCACCAELGAVWGVHGDLGLAISLFSLCVWWSKVWEQAEACPCGPLEEIFVMRKSARSSDTGFKILGQIVGGWLSWRYIDWIWCWHLSDQHRQLHQAPCEASLNVDPLHGALIEGVITLISRLIALESNHWNDFVSILANSLTTVALVLFAFNTTGGFFNPILASSLMIGCEGNTYWEHFQVYWIGSLLGNN